MTVQKKNEAPDPSPEMSVDPVVCKREGRGRLGGSRALDLIVQRTRHQGRRIKILDGDLRSRTLSSIYPPATLDGKPIFDGASSPVSEEVPVMKSWILDSLDEMVGDRVSRVLDLGGGDRVLQEVNRDLPIASYCQDFGIRLVRMCMLGPDMEDFRHIMELIRTGSMEPSRMMLMLNEGVIRQGQSVEGVFDPLIRHPDMVALVRDGARIVFFRRLTCMDQVQATGQSYYDIAAGLPNAAGVRPRPTMQHMVKVWLRQFETEHGQAGTLGWLP